MPVINAHHHAAQQQHVLRSPAPARVRRPARLQRPRAQGADLRKANVVIVAFTSIANTAFQPKVASMKALSHCQVPATISTGGAA